MSMLTLNGQIINAFDTPESVDKEGKTRDAKFSIQIMAENEQQNGQIRMELVTLKVDQPAVYKQLKGQMVRVPVGAFVSGTSILYYALKGAMPEPYKVAPGAA